MRSPQKPKKPKNPTSVLLSMHFVSLLLRQYLHVDQRERGACLERGSAHVFCTILGDILGFVGRRGPAVKPSTLPRGHAATTSRAGRGVAACPRDLTAEHAASLPGEREKAKAGNGAWAPAPAAARPTAPGAAVATKSRLHLLPGPRELGGAAPWSKPAAGWQSCRLFAPDPIESSVFSVLYFLQCVWSSRSAQGSTKRLL